MEKVVNIHLPPFISAQTFTFMLFKSQIGMLGFLIGARWALLKTYPNFYYARPFDLGIFWRLLVSSAVD